MPARNCNYSVSCIISLLHRDPPPLPTWPRLAAMMESLTALLYLLLHYLLPQAVLGWISLMEYPATSSKLSRPFQNTFTLSNSMRIRKHSIKILCKKISKDPWSHLFHSKSFYSLALVLCFLCGLSTERAFGLQLLPPLLTRYLSLAWLQLSPVTDQFAARVHRWCSPV